MDQSELVSDHVKQEQLSVLVAGHKPVAMVTECYPCELQVPALGCETRFGITHLKIKPEKSRRLNYKPMNIVSILQVGWYMVRGWWALFKSYTQVKVCRTRSL